jgi:YtkA-like
MRPMSRIALTLVVCAAAFPASAQAGGWATVELGRAPAGLVAGEPWRVELIVKQHGITPLADASPRVVIDDGRGVSKTFHARPTGTPGRYVAEVTFPSGGTWRARIYDGWTDAVPHRLAPLTVSPGGSGGGRFPWHQSVAIVVVALLWLGGWIAGYGWPHPHWRRHRAVRLRGRPA